MFTHENTEGFTAADLSLMNEALARLVAEGVDGKSASDRINNNWQPSGNTVESLIAQMYHWRTDSASGTVQATSAEHALDLLTAQGEWTDGAEDDGGWIAIGTEPQAALADLRIGQIP